MISNVYVKAFCNNVKPINSFFLNKANYVFFFKLKCSSKLMHFIVLILFSDIKSLCIECRRAVNSKRLRHCAIYCISFWRSRNVKLCEENATACLTQKWRQLGLCRFLKTGNFKLISVKIRKTDNAAFSCILRMSAVNFLVKQALLTYITWLFYRRVIVPRFQK